MKVFPKIRFSTETFCTHKLQFWQFFWIFCAKKPEYFSHSSNTVEKLKNFRRENSSIKNLLWTHRMQFWQTYRKLFAESPKTLCPKTKNKETIQGKCFQKKLFQKHPLHIWKQFWQPNKNNFAKNPKCFLTVSKQKKILKILWKGNLFLQKCSLDTNKTVLTTMSKNIYKIPNIFPESPLVGVNFLEEKDSFKQEDPLNGCWKQLFKSGGTHSDRCLQSCSSKLEKIVKVNIFFRKQTFLEKFCCSSRMRFWQLL